MIGTCPTGSIGFGVVSVVAAAACETADQDDGISRLVVVAGAVVDIVPAAAGVTARWSHRERCYQSESWSPAIVVEGATLPPSRHQRRQLSSPVGLQEVGALGTNATTKTMPSLVMRMLLKSVTTRRDTRWASSSRPRPG